LQYFRLLFDSITNFIDKFLIENTIEDPLVVTILGGFVNGLLGVIVLRHVSKKGDFA